MNKTELNQESSGYLPILVVEDDPTLLDVVLDTLTDEGYLCVGASSGPQAIALMNGRQFGLMLTDIQMSPMSGIDLSKHARLVWPSMPIIMMTAWASVDGAVGAMADGASDYLPKPFQISDLLSRVAAYAKKPSSSGIIAADPVSQRMLSVTERVAKYPASVLLTGESGSGKERVARHIHEKSDRSKRPFVAINCAAIPETLLESILFGHKKGAFTGAATSSKGKIESANGGTLFLDEIAEMPMGLQSKLLRVLQEREIEPVGSTETIKVDIRVISATHCDLKRAVADGRFRGDLYHRLNVFPLRVPSLRERRDDIEPIAREFVARYSSLYGRSAPKISASALKSLGRHGWPGNVRELENAIQRALILADAEIRPEHLALDMDTDTEALAGEKELPIKLYELEKFAIHRSLARHGGCRKSASDELGITDRTLRNKLKEYAKAASNQENH